MDRPCPVDADRVRRRVHGSGSYQAEDHRHNAERYHACRFAQGPGRERGRSKLQHKVITFVLAGGRGHRLFSLTKERAKPAVPFGGKYKIIDFVLSNLINSGLFSIYVLVQFKSQSLLRHLRDGWQFGGLLNDQFIIPVPAQMRSADEAWYRGTADAIYQNLNLIDNLDEHLVAIFGGDHVYRMNVRDMI